MLRIDDDANPGDRRPTGIEDRNRDACRALIDMAGQLREMVRPDRGEHLAQGGRIRRRLLRECGQRTPQIRLTHMFGRIRQEHESAGRRMSRQPTGGLRPVDDRIRRRHALDDEHLPLPQNAQLRVLTDDTDLVGSLLPNAAYIEPEGTYLAWLDLRGYGLESGLSDHIRSRAEVAVTEGRLCGEVGAGHIRFNFALPRPLLTEAVTRIARIL